MLTHNGGTSEPITDPARLLEYKNNSSLISSVGGNDAKIAVENTGNKIPDQLKNELDGGGSYLMTEEQFKKFAEPALNDGRPDGQFRHLQTR